jgi:hypothetical protein
MLAVSKALPEIYSREDLKTALSDFISYRDKVGTADLAYDINGFESHFYLHEKIPHL